MEKEKDGTQNQKSITDKDGTQGSEGITVENGTPDSVSITDTDGTQDQKSTTVEEKKSLKDIDPDELTDEQLEKLDLSEFEVEDEEQVKEKVEVEKETEKDDQAKDDAEQEPAKEIADADVDKKDDSEKIDPVKAAKAKLTKEEQRRSDLERENRELKQKLRKAQAGSFEELSEEELTELKYDDPDAYVQYQLDKNDYELSQKNVEQDVEQERMELQFGEISDFAKGRGIDVDNKKELREFLSSDKFKQLDQFVLNNLKPNAEGLYSSEQMDRAYRMLFADELLEKAKAEAKIKGVQETVDNITRIQKNGGGGSDLDRIKKTGTDKPKSATELTQEDIDNMSETELDQYEKELAALEKRQV